MYWKLVLFHPVIQVSFRVQMEPNVFPKIFIVIMRQIVKMGLMKLVAVGFTLWTFQFFILFFSPFILFIFKKSFFLIEMKKGFVLSSTPSLLFFFLIFFFFFFFFFYFSSLLFLHLFSFCISSLLSLYYWKKFLCILSLPQAAPSFIISPQSLDVTESSNLTLTCKAIGVPTPVITWKHGGFHIIETDRMNYSSSDGYGTLTITNVQESDNGRWSCLATNHVDSKLSPSDALIRVTRKW